MVKSFLVTMCMTLAQYLSLLLIVPQHPGKVRRVGPVRPGLEGLLLLLLLVLSRGDALSLGPGAGSKFELHRSRHLHGGLEGRSGGGG